MMMAVHTTPSIATLAKPPLTTPNTGGTVAGPLSRASQPSINSTLHGASAGSVREVLVGLKPGCSYRYGDTSVSLGANKSGGFSCPNDHAVTISYRWLILSPTKPRQFFCPPSPKLFRLSQNLNT